MILMGMCHAKIKMSKNKIVYDVGPTSNHCRRKLHRYIQCFMKPTSVYPNGQQDHIHVQSCSCILIQTNTFLLKRCFNSKLHYSTLLYELSKFKTIRVPYSNVFNHIYSNKCTQ